MKKLFIGFLALSSISTFASSYSESLDVYEGGLGQTVLNIKGDAAKEIMTNLKLRKTMSQTFIGQNIECIANSPAQIPECFIYLESNGKAKSRIWIQNN